MVANTSPTTLVVGKTVSRLGTAVDSGANCWSTATFYGPASDPTANLKLIRAFFDKYPEYISKVVLIVKGGLDVKTWSPVKGDDISFFRNEIEQVKAILGDKELDVYCLARLSETAVEIIFTNMAQFIKEGSVKAIGVSEMSAASLEKAHKLTRSTRFAPSLSMRLKSPYSHTSPRSATPSPGAPPILSRSWLIPPLGKANSRGQAFYENQKLVDQVEEIAKKKGVTTGQLALAWILAQSEFAIPIPGSTNVGRIRENVSAINVKLDSEELEALNKLASAFEVQGARYPEAFQKYLVSF
ncbi:pyridoxal reductase [Cryptococcus gattii E566]|nr:pyridoxal reductase [Cryptococcus gattii E566]